MIPTAETLTRANSIIQQIEELQAELVGLFASATKTTGKRRGRPQGSGRKVAVANGAPVKAQRRKMSPEARAKIAAAQRARWAKFRAAKK
ncbi:MAG: hypothetical protein KF833_17265 [Verrucomicrobiae bacterium]|nr:hypothetical protein [Verrucomicrobiae bacterium]